MKLYYWRGPRNNFGDDLNEWLWPRLLPNFFDERPDEVFVGIGTILTADIPAAGKKIVFGSGAWKGRPLPTIDESFAVYCVRGPLTANLLGLPMDRAIVDPAVLVRRYLPDNGLERTHISFMPHQHSSELGDWRAACERAGLNYIDAESDVETVLKAIQESRLLLTEAMHGAIVADALRVPWIAVKAYDYVLEFKWQDWCSSVGLEYSPASLPSLWRPTQQTGLVRRGIQAAKMRWAARCLKRIARHGVPQLSKDGTIEKLSCRLLSLVDQVRDDYSRRSAWNG